MAIHTQVSSLASAEETSGDSKWGNTHRQHCSGHRGECPEKYNVIFLTNVMNSTIQGPPVHKCLIERQSI
jgi:hypothetical protein